MELVESIERINYQLISEFGRELLAGNDARFRVVFSDDQFEKRVTHYTDEGFQLIHPEVRLLPKYRHWIQERYILERLVPVVGETDLVTKVSYEPAWVFQDKDGNYLPPRYDACKLIVETLYDQINKAGNFKKYKDPDEDPETKNQKLEDVERMLFGNETSVGDALTHKYGVVVPSNYEKDNDDNL